jgi:hypothetical protein
MGAIGWLPSVSEHGNGQSDAHHRLRSNRPFNVQPVTGSLHRMTAFSHPR